MSNAIDPGHYKGFSNGAQVIDISENLTSNAGQAVQYIARSCRLDGANKGDQIEDLTKAAWFIARELDRLAGIELAADKAKAAELDEEWATWKEVPDGIHYYSKPTGAGPWVNRMGVRRLPETGDVSCYSMSTMDEMAPFMRGIS
jgi:hypothetical protein